MTYIFHINREAGTWTADNPSGTEVASGELPLTDGDRVDVVLDDKGVVDPIRSAIKTILTTDWELTETQ